MGGILSRRYTFDPSTDLLDLTGKTIIVTGGKYARDRYLFP